MYEGQRKREPSSRKNLTGIPDAMRVKAEEKTGLSFEDVRVHYHSAKPAALQAYAYTQGNQVYIGPGQEKYLGHELGHVAQAKEGRVRATTQTNGIKRNDDTALEQEADRFL